MCRVGLARSNLDDIGSYYISKPPLAIKEKDTLGFNQLVSFFAVRYVCPILVIRLQVFVISDEELKISYFD